MGSHCNAVSKILLGVDNRNGCPFLCGRQKEVFVKEKIITSDPGVFMGLSTSKAHEGKQILFYDGDKLLLGLSLSVTYPTKRNLLPGMEVYAFFKQNLRMMFPEEAEKDIDVFVSPD